MARCCIAIIVHCVRDSLWMCMTSVIDNYVGVRVFVSMLVEARTASPIAPAYVAVESEYLQLDCL